MSIFLILPHQLFDKNYLDKKYNYIIWEHPHYFKKYNYNKKKIILHRGSMRYYYDYLLLNNFRIKYFSFKQKPRLTNYILFDPIDKIKLYGKYTIIESPNFLLNRELYSIYRDKTNKFFFNAFYMWGKKQINILPNVKSQDKHNRKKIPTNIKIPKIASTTADSKYVNIGIDYVNKYFTKNYGNVNNFIFPLTHKTAKKWLKHFIRYKLRKFGDYQDAIIKDESYLFHSVLSSSINIGLLNPLEIINEIMKHKIPLNSKEGFIRQLFWREYQRYCYIYYNFENKNYFGNRKKLSVKWYNASLGIAPVDDCIQKAFDTAYLHHIERLMIIGNYMNLSGIHPREGFRWFIEFSIDSYEWVMHQNVLEMVFFVGGDTMRRPYISSYNYIIKMSNYKKRDWAAIWDKKYHDFVKKNKKKLWKYRYYFRSL